MKTGSVILRISPEDKAAISEAADLAATTLTTFLVEAALKEARRILPARKQMQSVKLRMVGTAPLIVEKWSARRGGCGR